jgi:hypothetical protein
MEAKKKVVELQAKIDELVAKPDLSKKDIAHLRNYKKKILHKALMIKSMLKKADKEQRILTNAAAGVETEDTLLPAEDASALLAQNAIVAVEAQAAVNQSTALVTAAVNDVLAGVPPADVVATVIETTDVELTITDADKAVDPVVAEILAL